MNIKIAATSLLLVLALAACGGSGTGATPTTGSASSAPAESAAPSSAPSDAAPSATPSAAPTSAAADGTPITIKDFTLDPLELDEPSPVVLAVSNAGPTVHNLTIRDDAGKVLGGTADLRDGEAETLTVDLAAGSYIMFCDLPGHESLGMKGTLTVSE